MQYLVSKDEFTKITEPKGTLQNISRTLTIEVSNTQTENSGVLLPPMCKIHFDGNSVYVRCVDGAGAEARVIPFEVVVKGGDGGGTDFSLDQTGTTIVEDFRFSALEYPNATNPNLDGKTVLVMAVKDANATTALVKYVFVDLAKLVGSPASFKPSDNAIGISGASIGLNLSTSEENILSVKDDGLYAWLGIADGVSGNFAIIGESGAIVDGGFSIADIVGGNSYGGGVSYAVFEGATSIAGGASGLVPAPAIGDEEKFLRGDGTWALPNVSGSGARYTDFDGATSITGGTSGLVPAPAAGNEAFFLRGDGAWALPNISSSSGASYAEATTVSSGLMSAADKIKLNELEPYTLPTASASVKGGVKIGDGLSMNGEVLSVTLQGGVSSSDGATYTDFTGATSISGGASGLVPAPSAGDESKFLRGDGTWATVSSGSSGSSGYVIGSNVSTVEGGLWRDSINDVPVLKLRHGDYEYNFKYDNLTFLGGESSTLATVTPDTYVLGTASVSTEGGVWYEVNNNVPTLNLHAGNFNYSFNYDLITYKGGNSHLVSYLPFDVLPTADACGNVWTSTDGTVFIDSNIKKFGAGSVHLPQYFNLKTDGIFDFNADKWTVDFWFYGISSDATFETAVFSLGTSGQGRGVELNNRGYWLGNGSGSWGKKSPTYHPKANQWVHVAVVKDGLNFFFFEDGQLIWNTTSVVDTYADNTIYLGGTVYDSFYGDMYIDSFRYFDGVALWTSNFTPPTAADYS